MLRLLVQSLYGAPVDHAKQVCSCHAVVCIIWVDFGSRRSRPKSAQGMVCDPTVQPRYLCPAATSCGGLRPMPYFRMLRQRQASLLCSLAQLWRSGSSTAPADSAIVGLQLLQQPAAPNSSMPAFRQALQLVSCRCFSAMPARQAAQREFLSLNNLADNPGATHYVSIRAEGAPTQGLRSRACPGATTGSGRAARPFVCRLPDRPSCCEPACSPSVWVAVSALA